MDDQLDEEPHVEFIRLCYMDQKARNISETSVQTEAYNR